MRNIYDLIQGVAHSPKISRESASRIEDIQCASGYAEPGYTLEEGHQLLFGNWNDADKWTKGKGYVTKADNYVSRLATVLEKRYRCDLEWSDEWSFCSDCGKAFRTCADSFCWEPAFKEVEGDELCLECAKGYES